MRKIAAKERTEKHHILTDSIFYIDDHLGGHPRLKKGSHPRVWKYGEGICGTGLPIIPFVSFGSDYENVLVMAQVKILERKTGYNPEKLVQMMNDNYRHADIHYQDRPTRVKNRPANSYFAAVMEISTDFVKGIYQEDHNPIDLHDRRVRLLSEIYCRQVDDIVKALDTVFHT